MPSEMFRLLVLRLYARALCLSTAPHRCLSATALAVTDEGPSENETLDLVDQDNASFNRGMEGLEAGQSSPGAVEVPADLAGAISKVVAGYSTRSLRHVTRQLSEGLHDHSKGWLSDLPAKSETDSETESETESQQSEGLLAKWKQALQERSSESVSMPWEKERLAPRYSDGQVAAYAAARMPATYAALVHVLGEVKWQRPDFVPERMLDFGAGLGSTLWAARTVWGTWPKQVVAVEKARSMAQAADTLLRDAPNAPPVLRFPSLDALLKKGTNKGLGAHQHFDIVVAAYSLGEQESRSARSAMLRKLWARTKSILVIIEAGTPSGFEIVAEARELLLNRTVKPASKRAAPRGSDAHVLAPCPHDGPCPMSGSPQWCHFAQRLQRTTLQRTAKRASAALRAHEDEKFSYVVIQRGPRESALSLEKPASALKTSELIEGDDVSHESGQGLPPLDGSISVLNGARGSTGRSVEGSGGTQTISNQQNETLEPDESESEVAGVENEEWDEIANHQPREWARLTSTPRQRHGHVILDLCCAGEEKTGQLERRTISKGLKGEPGSKERYSQARKTRWGNRWHWDVG